jgi:two-component system CheB/CheR fusion protein
MALEECRSRGSSSTEGTLAQANAEARLLVHAQPPDIGRPLQDLEISYRPAELRSLIEQAMPSTGR